MKPDMRIDRYKTEKSHIVFWSSLSKCLHVQKWYEIHIGVEFISVILTDLRFNIRYELLCAHENMKIDNNTFQRFLFITEHLSAVLRYRCSQKVCNIHTKTPVLEPLFNKVGGLKMQAWTHAFLLKRDTNTGVFLRILQNFRTAFL